MAGAAALALAGCGVALPESDAGLEDASRTRVDGSESEQQPVDAQRVVSDSAVPSDARDASAAPSDASDASAVPPVTITVADATMYPGSELEQTVVIHGVPTGASFAVVPTTPSTGLTGTVTSRPGAVDQFVVSLAASATAPLATSVVELHMTAGATVGTASFQVHVIAAPTLDDLHARMIGSTSSTRTPLGVHFETAAARSYTTAQLAPLGNAASEPRIPGSTSGLHLATFHVTLYPHGRPDPVDVMQHDIGDCDGDAALAGMAYSAPAFVEHILHDNGDGTFTVAMYDPRGDALAVHVNSTFLAGSDGHLAAASGEGGVADWATVLEKAVMKYNDVYQIIPDVGGIGSEYLTPMFTRSGASYAFDRGVLTPAELRRVVTVALATGQFVTGGFGVVMDSGHVETVVGHAYTVMVPATAATMISMRNPWGMSPLPAGGYDDSADGVLDLPSLTSWSGTIDVRVIDPGAAGRWVRTTPFRYVHPGP